MVVSNRQQSPRKEGAKIIEINGRRLKKSKQGWLVLNNTTPVETRQYRGRSIDWDKVSCWDDKEKKYINTEYFQPVLYDLDDPMPTYKKSWEVWRGNGRNKKLLDVGFPPSYKRWWDKQVERCINGYEVGGVRITGPNYFFLNFWRIKTKEIGKGYIAPRFIDIGKLFFDYVEKAQQEDKNVMFLKRRQIGCSEMCAALVGWMYTFFPGSESIVIAGEGAYAENTTKKCRDALNEFARHSDSKSADPFYKRRVKDTLAETISGFMDENIVKGFQSRILCITTKDNTQKASGKSPALVIFEESGRFGNLQMVYDMVLPSMQEGGVQNGRICVFIGTGGEMDKGVEQMQEMFYDPEGNNLIAVPNEWDGGLENSGATCSVFFPSWLYYVVDYDGNSYKEEGIELHRRNREALKKKPKKLHNYKTQFPDVPSEAFAAAGLSPFNTIKLNDQQTRVLSNKWTGLVQQGRFDWIVDGKGVISGVKWTGADEPDKLDHEGDLMYPWLIWEHPEKPDRGQKLGNHIQVAETFLSERQYANLYSAGTDSYDKPDANWSDSKGSMSIFKGTREDAVSTATSMMFVARLTWRPSKPEKWYEQTAMGCVYYGCENLIEWSNIGIFTWYENNGWQHLLKERPLFVTSTFKDSKVNNRYGVDPASKNIWENSMITYIEDYSQNMYDVEQIKRAAKYRRNIPGQKRHNCDITVGAMLAYQHHRDNEQRRYKVVEINHKKKKGLPLFGTYRDAYGRLAKVA